MWTENVLLSGHSVYAYGIPKGVFRGRQSIAFSSLFGICLSTTQRRNRKRESRQGRQGRQPEKILRWSNTEKAERLPARLYKFSAIIFPLDGNGFFRYHPQIERIYPLSPQFGKILGAVIFIIISFGAVYVYCIGGLSYNLQRKVVLSKKNAEVYHAGDRSQKRF